MAQDASTRWLASLVPPSAPKIVLSFWYRIMAGSGDKFRDPRLTALDEEKENFRHWERETRNSKQYHLTLWPQSIYITFQKAIVRHWGVYHADCFLIAQ